MFFICRRNAEQLAELNEKIKEALERQTKAEEEKLHVQEMINQIARTLWKFCDSLRVCSYISKNKNKYFNLP